MGIFRKRKKTEPVPEPVVDTTPVPEVKEPDEEIESMEEDTILLSRGGEQPQAYSSSLSSGSMDQEENEEDLFRETTCAAEEMELMERRRRQAGMINDTLWADGKQLFGEHTVLGFRYYFDPENEGKTAAGLVEIPAELSLEGADKTVYCSFNGNMMKGPVEADGQRRFFDPQTCAMVSSALIEHEGQTYYYDAFGTQYRGLLTLEGEKKYFDLETGAMARGITVIPAELNNGTEKTVFFDDHGNMQFGPQEKDGTLQCFDFWDGHMFTGLSHLTSEYGGPKTVYFDAEGKMVIGSVLINGQYMYFSRNGSLVTNSTVRIGDQIYYYNQKGCRYYGPRYLKGKWKYFDEEDGHMLTGLVQLKDEDSSSGLKTVYYDDAGNMQFGVQNVDGKWKCFDNYDGHMFTGLTYLSREYGGPKTVYYDDDGDLQTGSVLVNGAWMFFKEDGDLVKNSLINIDGQTYYYNDQGVRQYGQKYLDGHMKYFDKHTGIMAQGLTYLDEEDEARGAKTVFYDEEGNMQFGLQEVDGSQKYFDEFDGHMCTGLVHLFDENTGHRTVYFDEEGSMVYGPRIVNGREMFFAADGSMVRNTLVEYDGQIYYYDQNGHEFHGQTKINGRWKLFDLSTGEMRTGLVHLSTAEEPAQEKTVYFDADGNMVFGLRKIDGKIKCFDLSTGAMKTGFVHLSRDYGDEKTVYFDEEGSMVFGPAVISGQSYLFDEYTGRLLKAPGSIREWKQEKDRELTLDEKKNNALMIYSELASAGWSMQASAGLIACMEEVSGLNPLFENHEGTGLLKIEDDDDTARWYNERMLEAQSGYGQVQRLIYEAANGLRWQTSSSYPVSFKEFTVLDFKPSFTAGAFWTSYLRQTPEKARGLMKKAAVWYRYLLENEG